MLNTGKSKNLQRIFLLFVLVQFLVISGKAQTTWVGTTNAWATATNWSTGNVPTSTTDVIINSGATFMPVISTTPITIKSLTINTGATLTINSSKALTVTSLTGAGNIVLAGSLTVGDATDFQFDGIISGAGTLAKAGTGSLTLTGANTYSGATTINSGTIVMGNNAALGTTAGTTTIATGGRLDLNGFTTAEPFSITGGSLVNMSASNSISSGAIAISGANTAIFAGTGNVTVSGVISGTCTLTKNGNGIFTLSAANTYVGTTTISAGTIKLGASNVIPDASAFTVTGTLDLNGYSETIGSLAGAGTVTSSSSGVITLTSGGDNTTTTFSGLIEDGTATSMAITKTGTGSLTLSGTNTYSGLTTVSAGSLVMGNNSALGAANSTTIASGATLDLNATTTSEQFTISGTLANSNASAATASGNLTLTTAAIISCTGNVTASGVIGGSGTLSKTGAGTLSLTGTNTFSGVATLNAGIIQLGNNSALGATGSTANTIIVAGTTLDLNGFSIAESITLSGSLLNNNATNSSISAAITLSGTGIFTGTGNSDASGVISGTGALSKTGTGTWTLSGTNTYTGATTIATGGTLKVGATTSVLGVNSAVTITGTLDLNGYNLEVGTIAGAGSITTSVAGTSVLTAGAKNTGSTTFTGIISNGSGQLALTKVGTGILVLSGTNTYTGTTNVNAGTINANNAAALGGVSTTSIASGATLIVNGFSLAEQFEIAGTLQNPSATAVTLSGGIILSGTAIIDPSGSNITLSGVISGTGGFTKNSTNTLTLSGSNTFSGAATISAGTLFMGNNNALGSSTTTTIASGATVDLNGTTTAEQFIVSGSLINSNTTTAATASGNITLTTAANFAGAGNVTASGVISGTGTLSKNDAGTWTLSGNNTFTGATTLFTGTLKLGHNNGLGSTTGITSIVLATIVDLNGVSSPEPFNISGSLVNNSGTAATSSGNLILDTSAIFGGTGNVTASGIISSTGTLQKTGAGIWTLSGANTFTAAITLSAGTLKAGSANSILGPTTNAGLSMAASTTLDLNGYSIEIGSVVSATAGAGSITNSSSTAATLTTGANNTNTTFSGIISDGTGSVSLIKKGTGTFTISGVNTYTGATTVNAGTLSLGNASALGSNTTPTTISTGATLGLAGMATTESFINSGTISSSGTITLTGNMSLVNTGIITGAGTITLSGVVSGTGNLQKAGGGIWILTGTNTYSGATTVTAGTLKMGSADALGTVNTTTITAGALDLNGFSTAELFNISGSLANNGATASTVSGAITLTTAAIIGGTGNVTASGVISGTGTLQKTGAGTWTLTGTNTYSGTTTVAAGTLKMGSNDALGTTAATIISSGAFLELDGYSTSEQFTISGSLNNNNATPVTLTGAITLSSAAIIGGSGNVTVSGVISSTGTLEKKDAGTWTLTGTNTYSGTTQVTGGTLKFGNNAALGSTAATTILSGTYVDLNGFSTAEVFVLSGSLLNNSTTNSTITGAITLTTAGIIGGTGNVIASGIISSTGTLQKTGTGTWTLSGANTYSGTSTISAGILKFGNIAALGTTAVTTIASGATVDLNGFTTTEPYTLSGSLVNNSATAASSSGAITLTTAGIIGGSGNATLSGVISSTGTLQKTGESNWSLNAANTFTGAFTISAGTITIGNATGLGANASRATIAAGATVNLNGKASGKTLTISGTLLNNSVTAVTYSGAITLTGSPTFGGTGNFTISGAIGSTGSFTKTGVGTITLSNAANTFTGGVTINAGTLSVSTIGNGGVAGNLGQATNAAANLVLGGGQLTYSGATASTDRNITLTANTVSQINISTAATTLTVSGTTSNTNGGFTKEGPGTLTFSGTNQHTGVTFVNAGILNGGGGISTVAAGQTMYVAVGQTVTIPSGSTLTNNGTVQVDGTLTIAGTFVNNGTISGTGTYEFSGTAAQTIPAATTYPNLTISNTAGVTLGGTTTTTAQLTINASNTLQLAGNNLTVNSLTGSGNIANTGTCPVLTINGSTSTTYSGIISGCTGLTKSGTGTLTLSGTNTYTGATTIAGGVLSVATIGNGGVAGNLGAATVDAANLLLSGGTLRYTGATASTNRNITLIPQTSSTIEDTVTATSLTWSGVISSSGSIAKTGNGTLVLTGINTYTGATTITAGTLSVDSIGLAGVVGNLGAAANLASNLVFNGGTLLYTGVNNVGIDRNFTLANGTTSTINISLASTVLSWNGNSAATTGGLRKAGIGVLYVGGTNSYTGLTTIAEGTLAMTKPDALGNSTNGIVIASGAGLDLFGTTMTYEKPVTVSGTGRNSRGAIYNSKATEANFAGRLTLAAATTLGGTTGGSFNLTNRNSITGAFALTLDGTVGGSIASIIATGAGTITKTGTGTWLLSGTNTYTGATTVSAGILKLGNTSALGTTGGGVTVASGAALDLNGIGYTAAEAITLNGTGISSGGAIMNSSATTATYGGLVTLASASSIIGETGSINLTNTGAITGAFGLTLGGTQGGVLSSQLNTGVGTLTKEGTGTWKIAASGTYSGATNINSGVLRLGASSAANSGPLGTSAGTTTISSGASLDFNGFSLTSLSVEPIVPSGNGYSNQGAITNSSTTASSFNGTINSTAGADFSIGGTGQLTISGVISGNKNFTKIGSNTVLFTGTANTYTGSTIISEGALNATNINMANTNGTLGYNSSIILDGGTLIYPNVTGNCDRPFTLNANKNSTINISTASTTATLNGVFSGAGSLTKAGAGTLALAGVNTFTGSTTVSAGVLSLGTLGAIGSSSNAGAGSTVILNGGTLTYTGATASSDRNFTLNSATTSTVTVNTANVTLTLSGVVSGAGAIKVNNNASGTLELTGSNTYTGVTTISAGVLKVSNLANGGSNSSIGASSNSSANLVIGAGTFLYSGTTASTDRSFTLIAGTVPTFNIENSATTLTISGSCGSTTAGLLKIGSGTLALTGTNRYTGVTYVRVGTLSVNSINNGGVAGAMGAATNAVGKLLFQGGTLEYTGGSTSTNRNFTIGAGLQAAIKVTNAATNLTWAGITNASTGGITKTGSGTLTLAGLNTYTGITYINEGILKLGTQKVNLRNGTASTSTNSGPLGAAEAAGGGGAAGTGTTRSTVVANGATLDYNGYIVGTVGYSYNTTTLAYTNNYYYENITINGTGVNGAGAIINSSTKALTNAYSYTILGSASTIGGTGNYPLTYYSGSTTLTKTGINTISFNSTVNNTGNIVINQGVLQTATTGYALGSTAGSTTVNDGGTLDLNGVLHNNASILEPLILNGSGYNGIGALYNGKTTTASFQAPITLNSLSAIGGLGVINLYSTISGTGGLVKIGTKQLTLAPAASNTYSGSTTISGGTLNTGNFAALGASDNSASNLVFNGGTLLYNGNAATFSRSFTVADGTNNIFMTSAASSQTITLTGSSTGGGSLTKAGTAAWLVQGTLNHTGAMKDSAGVIELANTNGDALADNGTFIFGGGTLKTKSNGANETAGSFNLVKSSTLSFANSATSHSINFANSSANRFTDGKILTISNWVKGTRNADSTFNSGAAGKIFVGTNNTGVTAQQRGKIRFTINTNISSTKYLTFPGVYSTGTTLKKFYNLSAEQLPTGELVPAVPHAILDIQGSDGKDTICTSQSRTYNYTISNIGDIDADNVNVTSDNPNFVIGTKTGSTTVTAVTTVDSVTSTPGSTITFPVVFTSGAVAGTQTLHLITTSTTSRTDNDTLTLEVYVTGPPSFSSATSGGACYSDQFATLNATSTGGSYISWHTSMTPTAGDTAYIGNPFIIDPLTATTTYYAQANLGSCVSQGGRTAVTATLNAPASAAVMAASVTSICNSGTTNISVTVTGGTRPYTLIYNNGVQDVMVPNYESGTPIPVTVSASTTFSITSLTDALGCDCEDISTSGSVSVDVISAEGGTPLADVSSICPGNTALLTLYDYNGDAFQWQQSANGTTNWTNVSGGVNPTTDAYTTAALNTTTYYRASVTNSTCPAVYSDVIPVTVNASVGGTLTSTSICTGNTTTLTLTGYSGNSFIWQQSDDGTNFEQVSGGSGATTYSFTTPNLYNTKYYEVIVTNGTCTAATSNTATITVSPASIAGTITVANATVCTGTNSNTLTLSNYVGSIQWQSASTLNGTYSNIAGATAATLSLTNLTATTYYRALVTSGNCSADIADPVLVTVSPTSVAGTISGGGVVCATSNTSILTLTGYTGDVQWQQSTDYGITYTNISGATDASYTVLNLSQSTYYLANVTSGACALAGTDPVLVDVTASNDPTTIGGTTEICIGETTTLTTSAACESSNSIFVWYANGQGSDAFHEGWETTTSVVSNAQITINNNTNGILNVTSTNTDAQLTMTGLGSFDASVYKYINMRYRVTSGTAGSVQFHLFTSTVSTVTNGFAGTGTLISDNNWHTVSIDISSLTSNGAITGWRFDPTNANGVTMDIDFIQLGTGAIVGTGATLAVTPSTSTRYYVNKNGNNLNSDYISELVTVNPLPTPSFTTQPGAAACINTNVSYYTQSGKTNYNWTLPGTRGTDYTLVAGGTTSDNMVTVKWLTSGTKTVTINYTLGCAAASATSSTPTAISLAPVGGTATAAATPVCIGSNTTISLTGYTGNIQWQSSSDGASWTDVSTGSGATSATYTTSALTETTYFKAQVGNAVCAADTSSSVQVTINPLPTTADAGMDQTGAATCGQTSVTLAANTPSIGTGAWTIVSGSGGSFSDPSSPTATFSGTAGTTYTLRWSIANSPCSASTDDVVITFNQNPTTANAGSDQTSAATCGQTTLTLAGNTPTVGTGAWSIVSGTGGSFGDSTSAASSFSGTTGSTYTLRWTTSNTPCTSSSDEMVVILNQNPTIANAGPDQNVTGSIALTLAANTPTDGTGVWSIVSGSGGSISDLANPVSTFSGTELAAYTLRWTISNSTCSTSDDVIISSGHVWTGAGGDDLWSNGNNWTPGTAPVTGSTILINTGTPNLDTDFSVGRSLTIAGTGTLTVNPGITLSIASGGVADFNNRLVTFKSNITGSGQLGMVEGTLSNATNVTVERHIPTGKRAFRFIASPVTTTTSIRHNWMEGAVPGVLSGYPYTSVSIHNPHPSYGTLITGLGGNANGFDATLLNNPSLFRFNNSTGAWVTMTTTAGTIAAGSAYRILLRGDRSYNMALNSEPAGGATTLRTNGTIAQGELTTGVQLPALSQDADGWSLVGNPYQSVVDMHSSEVVKNNLTDYYYIWDPRQGTRGAYVAYNMTLASSGSNNISSGMTRYVQPGQAFFVQNTTAGGNSLVFREAAKAGAIHKTATFGIQQQQETVDFASLSAILYYTDSLAVGRESMDAIRTLFGNRFSNAVDDRDGGKFSNLDETMSIKRGNDQLSMELRARPNETTTVPLNITQYRVKRYTLRLLWDQPLNDDTLVAYLRDKYLEKDIKISQTGFTDVPYELDGQPASSASDRFELVFKSTANTVAAISGTPMVCVGGETQLSNATPGGVWASLDSSIVKIDATGAIKGITAGTAEVSYTVPQYGIPRTVKQSVTVNALPAKPTITRDIAGNLISSAPLGNQWYNNNVFIIGATSPVFKPLEPSYYRVRAMENGCAGELSNTYYYTTGPLIDSKTGSFVRIFPNPVQSEVKIEFMLNELKSVEVQVYDMKGHRVLEYKGVMTGTKINMLGLASGVYRFSVLSSSGTVLYSYTVIRE